MLMDTCVAVLPFYARTSEIAYHQMKPKARVNVTYDTKFTLQKERKVPCKSRGVLHKACWSNVIITWHYRIGILCTCASSNCLMAFHIHLKWLWNMLVFSHGDKFERTGEDEPTSISFLLSHIRFAWLVGFALDHEEEKNSIFIVCCCNPMLCLPCVKLWHQRLFHKMDDQTTMKRGKQGMSHFDVIFHKIQEPLFLWLLRLSHERRYSYWFDVSEGVQQQLH